MIDGGAGAGVDAGRRRARAPDADDRYATAVELSDDVARFRAGEAVHAHHEGPVERAQRVFTRYRTAILLVLAYLVMRVIVAVFGGL